MAEDYGFKVPRLPLIRRPRGRLEELLYELCSAHDRGELDLPEGQALTPYRLVKLVDERFPGSGVSPSTGGVRDCLTRWADTGCAVLEREPFRFVAFTPTGRQLGLEGMRRARQAQVRRQATPEERGASGRSVVTDVVTLHALPDGDGERLAQPVVGPLTPEGMGLPETGA